MAKYPFQAIFKTKLVVFGVDVDCAAVVIGSIAGAGIAAVGVAFDDSVAALRALSVEVIDADVVGVTNCLAAIRPAGDSVVGARAGITDAVAA